MTETSSIVSGLPGHLRQRNDGYCYESDFFDARDIKLEDLPDWWQDAIKNGGRKIPYDVTFTADFPIRAIPCPALAEVQRVNQVAKLKWVQENLDEIDLNLGPRVVSWFRNCVPFYGFFTPPAYPSLENSVIMVPVRAGWLQPNTFRNLWLGRWDYDIPSPTNKVPIVVSRPPVRTLWKSAKLTNWHSPYPPTDAVISKILKVNDGENPEIGRLRDLFFKLSITTDPVLRDYAKSHMQGILREWGQNEG